MKTLKISQKGMVLVLVPMLLQATMLLAFHQLLLQARDTAIRECRARRLSTEAISLAANMEKSRSCLNNFASTQNKLYQDSYRRYIAHGSTNIHQLQALTRNDRQLSEQVAELADQTRSVMNLLNEIDSLISSSPRAINFNQLKSAVPLFVQSKDLEEKAKNFAKMQNSVEISNNSENTSLKERLELLIWFALIVDCAAAIGLSVFFSRQINARLAVISDNTVRLSVGERPQEPLSGDDEIAKIDWAFHRMSRILSEAARKERAVIENAVDVICSIDKQGRFQSVSPSAHTVWGYAPVELIGRRYMSIVCRDDASRTLAEVGGAMNTSNQTLAYENRIVHRDGRLIDVQWSGCWSRENNTLFCVAHDARERKKLERLKQEFVQMVSHDLRTPLTAVQCFLELVEEGFYDQIPVKLHSKAKLSKEDVARLIALVNNLLDIEKLESGMMQVDCQVTAVSKIFERSVESIRPVADRNNIRILCDKTNLKVFADEDQLVQVIVNLASNAVKFSPSGKTVVLSADMTDSFVRFRIQDSGRGIPASNLDRIFNRFEQVEMADARLKGGSGLGLAICKTIVEAHKGRIGVDSVEGLGSTFWFDIPSKDSDPLRMVDMPTREDFSVPNKMRSLSYLPKTR